VVKLLYHLMQCTVMQWTLLLVILMGNKLSSYHCVGSELWDKPMSCRLWCVTKSDRTGVTFYAVLLH